MFLFVFLCVGVFVRARLPLVCHRSLGELDKHSLLPTRFDRHMNFFLFGSIEIPAILLVVFLLKIASRRFNTFLFLCMSGGALALLAIARLSTEKIEGMTDRHVEAAGF